MLQQLLALPASMPGRMYGLNGFRDKPELPDYCPWEHAEILGATIVSNRTLPDHTPAAYSNELRMIFYRADLPEDVERCAIAHELVHWEYRDRGKSPREEARADRLSTLRLIRPSLLAELPLEHNDLAGLARELDVTENTMRRYANMARNGTLPWR